MFRRSFLHEHGIVFPEGRRRLEDQLFVVRAYFAAGIVSILADEPCYFYLRRDDHGNAGSVLMDPATYYANLRDVIDVVLANTVPGEERARLLRRFCRVEMLGRLRRPEYLEGQPTFQADMFANIRDVFLDVSDPVVEAGLGTIDQLRAQLIRDDRPAAMLELGRRTFGLRTTATIESARWAAGRLRITFTAEVLHEDGTPLVLRRSGSTLTLDPRLTDGVATEPIDVNEALGQARVGAFLRESTSSIEWVVPTRSSLILTPIDPTTNEADSANDVTDVAADDAADQRVVLRGSFALDVETVAAGRRLRPGSWAIRVRVGTFGLDLTAELPGDEPAAIAVLASLPPLWSEPRRLVTLDRTPGGHLCVQVDRMDRPPRGRRVYRSAPSGPLWRALAVPSRMARQVHRRLPPRVRDASSSVWRAARRLRQPKR
jgi:hypothetical protein